ncbi:hypothetical protein LPB67_06620 [Undibacterium sp. Jales W-56]|uniref:hypothetical protein n=1 Tax=Undibacterium sp. Jales W-56 TaxID=2897325 RepID=UPI0021CECFF6|nr:hypothetical protein [Undibacterium sp. Jales W-56]MCU6433454.1 hypothetical protein [Undibacterium sp. Jales W-56]
MLVLSVGLSLSSELTLAAPPNDFRVLTDDISTPGSKTLKIQSSVARPSSNFSPDSGRLFQGLGELAYGLSEQWEISAQAPVTRLNGNWYSNGINLELQYVAPHDDDDGFYWGARTELGYASQEDDKRTWQAEFRPILGYRISDWHFAMNPAVTTALSGEDRKAKFEPSAKLSYQVDKSNAVSMEYFVDAGPLSHFLPRSRRNELALIVLDSKIGKSEINLGVGRGMTSISDRWVVKFILSTTLD